MQQISAIHSAATAAIPTLLEKGSLIADGS
jgi:hypothetical protein